MTNRAGRFFRRGLLGCLYLVLIAAFGWKTFESTWQMHLPDTTSLQVETGADRIVLSLAADGLFERPATAVSLPLGPDALRLPGQPRIWRELGAALAHGAHPGKAGFDGLQLMDSLYQYERREHVHLELGHPVVDMQRFGDHAYLLNAVGEVLVLDLTDSARPSVLGTVPVSGKVRGLTLYRNALLLLTALGSDYAQEVQHVLVMDLSAPSRPREVARQSLPLGAEKLIGFDAALGVHFSSEEELSGFLQIYEMGEAFRLTPRARVDDVSFDSQQFNLGGFWYVQDRRDGLRVFALPEASPPREVGRLVLPEPFSEIAGLADRLFLLGTSGRLWTVDVSEPNAPLILSSTQGGPLLSRVAFVNGMTFLFSSDGGLHAFEQLPRTDHRVDNRSITAELLVPGPGRFGFLPIRKIDLTLPRVPDPDVLSTGLILPTGPGDVDACWWRQRLLVLTDGHLRWYALQDQGRLEMVANLPVPQTLRWLTATSDRVYVGGEEQLLVVAPGIDNRLHLSGNVPLPQVKTWSAVVVADTLLVAAGEHGLLRFGLEHPDQPLPLPTWTLPKTFAKLVDLRRLVADGDRFFAAAGPVGLLSGRVKAAGEPELLGRLALDGPVRELVASSELCLAATPEAVHVIDIRQDAEVQKIGVIAFAGVERLALAGQDHWAGLAPDAGLWSILPFPRLMYAAAGPLGRVRYALSGGAGATAYAVNLFNRHGVSELPGTFELTATGSGAGKGGPNHDSL